MQILSLLCSILGFKFIQCLFFKDYKLYCYLPPKHLFFFIFFLKNFSILQFKILTDFTVSDCPDKKKRFAASYFLLSPSYSSRICVSLKTNETNKLISIINLFKNANWSEREIWDMFGIVFYRHKDLRRILTDYGFSGFPLRKDFPLTGFIEISYNQQQKRVAYNRVVLSQEYRNFWFDHYTSYWGFQKFKLHFLTLKVFFTQIFLKKKTLKNNTSEETFNVFQFSASINLKTFFFNLWKDVIAPEKKNTNT